MSTTPAERILNVSAALPPDECQHICDEYCTNSQLICIGFHQRGCELDELAMPPSITLEMAKGFTLYMAKAVINGRGDEVLDLARSNLWR